MGTRVEEAFSISTSNELHNNHKVYIPRVKRRVALHAWVAGALYSVRANARVEYAPGVGLSLIHISEPTRPY